MKKYRKVYSFDVLDKIKEGHRVFVIDREEKKVSTVNWIDVEEYITIVADETERYDFWIEVEESAPCAEAV